MHTSRPDVLTTCMNSSRGRWWSTIDTNMRPVRTRHSEDTFWRGTTLRDGMDCRTHRSRTTRRLWGKSASGRVYRPTSVKVTHTILSRASASSRVQSTGLEAICAAAAILAGFGAGRLPSTDSCNESRCCIYHMCACGIGCRCDVHVRQCAGCPIFLACKTSVA